MAQLMPRTNLRDGQSSCSSMTDPMGGDFPNVVGDVLQSIDEQGASGIHHLGRSIHRFLEGLELPLQSFLYQMRDDKKKVYEEQPCLKEKPACYSGVDVSQHCSGGRGFALSGREGSLGGLEANLKPCYLAGCLRVQVVAFVPLTEEASRIIAVVRVG